MFVYVLFALLPIAAALILMMEFKVKPGIALFASWLLTAVIGAIFWRMNPALLTAASIVGVSKAVDIVLIILGAVLLLNVQRKHRALRAINHSFRDLSKDRRIQVLLIAWLFSGLIEGAAGFGAAPPIVASFLVGLGFPAMSAVAVGLIGNTLPVPFGGVGIPSMTLFRTLETDLQQKGISPAAFDSQLLDTFTAISGISGLLIPFGCVVMVIMLSKKDRKLRSILEILPLSIVAGLVYIIPWRLTALYLGPELPSIIGAIVGLPVFILILKMKWFVPAYVWDFPENELSSSEEMESIDLPPFMPAWKAWMPYIVLTLLLLLTRNDYLPFHRWLREYGTLRIPQILGVKHTEISFNLLNNPGFFPFVFIAGFLICKYKKEPWKVELQVVWKTVKQLLNAGLAIFMAFAMVQIMIFSAYSDPQMPGMLKFISSLGFYLGDCYLIAAQILGVFGSFFGGSCTVSNILFASLQFQSAQMLKLPADVVLALQNTGSGLGGMIRISGVIAACAAVKIDNKTGDILRLNLIPVVIFSILALITALFFC